MKEIDILSVVDEPENAEKLIREIKTLRNRIANINGTIRDFSGRLAMMTGLSTEEVLNGLDTERGVIILADQSD